MTVAPLHPDALGTLCGLFRARVAATPEQVAYRQFDEARDTWLSFTWAQVALEVVRWQAALVKEGLVPGDRVAVMLKNCVEWVIFDQAALSLGLVTVPLYLDDRPDSAAYMLDHADAKLLLVEGKSQHRKLAEIAGSVPRLQRIVSLVAPENGLVDWSPRFVVAADWLAAAADTPVPERHLSADLLASIVYTSGTTGRPKGAMLTHENLLWNAFYASQCADFGPHEVFLSFLPLSHTLERTGGYYLPMLIGAEVAYARSIAQLAQDLQDIRPTVLISVPRIYERVYGRIRDGLAKKGPLARKLFKRAVRVGWRRFEHGQGRAAWHPELLLWPLMQKLVAGKVTQNLGGRLKLAISGGAALSPEIARVFVGLGVPIYQGYGLTETSPVVCVNRPDSNVPAGIGQPLPGIEVKIGGNDELLTRSRCVMRGYWKDEEATRAMIDSEGWLQQRRQGQRRRQRPLRDRRTHQGHHRAEQRREGAAHRHGIRDPARSPVRAGDGRRRGQTLSGRADCVERGTLAGLCRQPRYRPRASRGIARPQGGEGADPAHGRSPQAFSGLCPDPSSAPGTQAVDRGRRPVDPHPQGQTQPGARSIPRGGRGHVCRFRALMIPVFKGEL